MKKIIFIIAATLCSSLFSSHAFAQINSPTMYLGTTVNAGSTGSYFGSNVTATGFHSFAGGSYCSSTGSYSFSQGNYSTASGSYSAALGVRNTASNSHAYAFGIDLSATANRSMVFGSGVVSGVGSGTDLTNNIQQSLMIGFNSDVPTFFVGPSSGLGTYGNVGIGTSTPAERLHVNGNGKVEGSWRVEHSTTTDWNYGLSVWVNRDKTKAFTVNESVTGTNLFTIWGNGVVNAKNIYAEEIEVRVDALGIYWPDYVFKPTYQLRPLSEVASFVATNHHLPDVPSEVEIMEEGLNLGEMDAILLRKIEELTLYMIEQQEEIERLKKLVEESTNNQ